MNLRNKIILITIVTIIALVGVGFATWTFTNLFTESVSAISGAATAAIVANNVQVKTADGSAAVSALYIICDSPNNGGHGIYWSTTKDTNSWDNRIEQVMLVGSVNENDFNIADFTKYTGTSTGESNEVTAGTWIDAISAIALNKDVESASKNADVKTLVTLPTLSYKDIPENVAEVEALQTEANAISITITFHFNVKSVA